MDDPAVAQLEDGDLVDPLSKRRPVAAWPSQAPRWVAEQVNRPTTVSPSAISSTICHVDIGEAGPKGVIQRLAAGASSGA
jgi:hypothetical protein